MDKLFTCVAINKAPNGSAAVVFHLIGEGGKVLEAFTRTFLNAKDADAYEHLAKYKVELTKVD